MAMSHSHDGLEAREADLMAGLRSAQDFAQGAQAGTLNDGSSGATVNLSSYATGSTWIERLVLTLLSYSIVLLPIAFIVIATRYKLFPKSILASAPVQWFVYGKSGIGVRDSSRHVGESGDDVKLLLEDQNRDHETATKSNGKPPGRQQASGELPKRPLAGSGDQATSGSTTLEFLFCLIGLQVSYLIWGLLQEKIMTTEYAISAAPPQSIKDLRGNSSSSSSSSIPSQHGVFFSDSQFLVFINRLMAFVTAILAFVYTRHRQARLHAQRYASKQSSRLFLSQSSSSAASQKGAAPLYKFVYSSLSNILSSWCQYEALKYVNFPTQCLSKSCKVIPVMLMSKLLMNKRYPCLDYLCALLLALGMFVFMLHQPPNELAKHHHNRNKPPSSDNNHPANSASLALSGVAILALYLTFDSFTSNWQQKLYARYDISNWQMMAASNFYSLFLTLTSLHQLGNLRPAFELLASSQPLLRDCLVMSLMSSVGQMFVYYTIKRFGSVLFAVIMTLRQFLSILLSCAIYKHQLNAGALLGLLLVFLVVGFQVWHKSAARRNKTAPPSGQSGQRNSSATMARAPQGPGEAKESFASFGRQLGVFASRHNEPAPPNGRGNFN